MGQFFKNTPRIKMTDCWLTFGYACGLFVGGLLGLNHEDPNISMGMGLINAAGATYGAYLIHENPNDIKSNIHLKLEPIFFNKFLFYATLKISRGKSLLELWVTTFLPD